MKKTILVFIIFLLITSSLLVAMKCPKCGHNNTEESDFCTECGTRLRYELEVNSKPNGASVYLNDEFKGNTPYKLEGLNYGETYTVKIEKMGFISQTKTWAPTLGVNPNKLEVELKPSGNMVAFKMTSEPSGAIIYLARKNIGKTPYSGIYPPGTFSMKLEKNGYDSLKKDVTFTKGGINTFNFILERSLRRGNPGLRQVLRYSALGLGALGIGSYVLTMSKYNEYKDNKDPEKMDDLYKKANTMEGISLGLLGTGAICLGLSFAF